MISAFRLSTSQKCDAYISESAPLQVASKAEFLNVLFSIEFKIICAKEGCYHHCCFRRESSCAPAWSYYFKLCASQYRHCPCPCLRLLITILQNNLEIFIEQSNTSSSRPQVIIFGNLIMMHWMMHSRIPRSRCQRQQ